MKIDAFACLPKGSTRTDSEPSTTAQKRIIVIRTNLTLGSDMNWGPMGSVHRTEEALYRKEYCFTVNHLA